MQPEKRPWLISSYTIIKRRNSNTITSLGCVKHGSLLKLGLLAMLVGPYIWVLKHITETNIARVSLPFDQDFGEYFRDLNTTSRFVNNDDRLNHLHKMCKRLGLIRDPVRASVLRHILVDDKHRLLYCGIPKVACTTWKTVLVNLSANFPEPMPPNGQRLPVHSRIYLRNKNIRPLDDYFPEAIRYRLDNYFTFMVVRHPLDRVVSAFKDKMDLSDAAVNNHWLLIQREIIQRYRQGDNYTLVKNLTELAYSPIGFQEFVRYALRHFRSEQHWRTFYDSCLPCTIRYDKVVKMETMDQDAEEVLRSIGVPVEQRKIPHFNSNSGARNKTMYEGYLKQLMKEDLNDLLATYNKDMQLFGYA